MLRSHKTPYRVLIIPNLETAEQLERALKHASHMIENDMERNANKLEVEIGSEARSVIYDLRCQIGAIKE